MQNNNIGNANFNSTERYAALDFCSLFVLYCGKKTLKISKNEIKRIALKRLNTGDYSK